MCNWSRWIWPGLITVALLTVLWLWFGHGPMRGMHAGAASITKLV